MVAQPQWVASVYGGFGPCGLLAPLFAQQNAPAGDQPGIAAIDPPTRAKLLLALLGLILLGGFLIVATSLGARMVRRWARYNPPPRPIGRSTRPPIEPDLSAFDENAATHHDDLSVTRADDENDARDTTA